MRWVWAELSRRKKFPRAREFAGQLLFIQGMCHNDYHAGITKDY
jgi:hypothetical protein